MTALDHAERAELETLRRQRQAALQINAVALMANEWTGGPDEKYYYGLSCVRSTLEEVQRVLGA